MDARFFESLQLQIKIKKKKKVSPLEARDNTHVRALRRVTIIPIDYITRSVIARE